MSSISVLGRLGKDPEIRYGAKGGATCTFSIASDRRERDESGTYVKVADWYRVVCFGKLAEICAQHLSKGSQAMVSGAPAIKKWQGKTGDQMTTVEIVANDVRFVGGKKEESRQGQSNFDYGPPPIGNDQVPF